jgi:hypothetical protein
VTGKKAKYIFVPTETDGPLSGSLYSDVSVVDQTLKDICVVSYALGLDQTFHLLGPLPPASTARVRLGQYQNKSGGPLISLLLISFHSACPDH